MGLLGYGITTLVTIAFFVYLGNSFYTFYNLFHPAICPERAPSRSCVHPYFSRSKLTNGFPFLGLHIRVSDNNDPFAPSSIEVYNNSEWDVENGFEFVAEVKLPTRSRRNGTLFGHVILLLNEYRKDDPKFVVEKLVRTVKLTSYKIPDATAFNLITDSGLTEGSKGESKNVFRKPVAHLRSKLFISFVNEDPAYPVRELPSEVIGLMQIERVENNYYYWPLFHIDEMSTRLADLTEIKPDATKVNLTINYRPLSIGKLRLLLMGQASFAQFSKLGLTEKDFDEIKGIFTDTNFYFLLITVFVSSVHLLLDVLSFKNDISFWKARKTMVGLSTKTLIWRSVSQSIVFLYLFDSKPSMIVLLPFGFGVLVEYWKLTKALKVEWRFPLPRLYATSTSAAEKQTNEYDSEAMGYLSKVMIPLCIAGAIYSLIYLPHKSWYSWGIHSMANGVYAFGFLFMLPQLFLNYKLKSVAHLPWRAFMYKAFNTFIDDIFAFIITMPTAHRLACFRDDFIFLIYLYQRYLYPVDKTRVNEFGEAFEEESDAKSDQKKKKN